MNQINNKDISRWQNALHTNGHFIAPIPLSIILEKCVEKRDFEKLDYIIHNMLENGGLLFKFLKHFDPLLESVEHIISLREASNEWEEDGIWHDDGSRRLAFSLSLTHSSPEGGVLELRKKGSVQSTKIVTPPYGNIIVFQTGHKNYEHKINKVTKGARLIIAGWCS